MKTLVLTAVTFAFAAPAFADDGLEGRVLQPGEANPVVMSQQLAAGSDVVGMDAVSVIRLTAAEASDDFLSIYSLRTAPETVSTQGTSGGVNAQFLASINTETSDMNLSEATAAYFDEVAD